MMAMIRSLLRLLDTPTAPRPDPTPAEFLVLLAKNGGQIVLTEGAYGDDFDQNVVETGYVEVTLIGGPWSTDVHYRLNEDGRRAMGLATG